jgi:hypothetical protein
MVFVRQGRPLPREGVALLDAPRCYPGETPIQLLGSWGTGIPAGNPKGATALSYDIIFFVRKTSVPSYQNVLLTVRIPASISLDLLNADDEGTGGTIKLVVGCQGSRFIAQQLRTEHLRGSSDAQGTNGLHGRARNFSGRLLTYPQPGFVWDCHLSVGKRVGCDSIDRR